MFRFAIAHFLDTIDQKEAQLRTLLTENFQIIDPTKNRQTLIH